MQSMTKELNLAHQIQATKSQCQQTLQQIQSVQHLFENVGDMTQIGLLEAIDSAILYIDENPPPEDDLAHKARKLYSTMERFLWELAMSAEHLAVTEARKRAHFSLRREDLIQEGYIGLLEAAKRFDAGKQIRFTTYARWWVRAQMNRAQEKTGRLIRLPGGAVEQTRNLKEVLNQFSVEAQGISIEEAANIVGISHRRASLLLQQDSTISLDKVGNDGLNLNDRLASEDMDPYETVMCSQAIDLLQDQFESYLDKREQMILVNYFGLNDNPTKTMKSIGEEIVLSRERVRQIKGKALDKLRTMF